MEQWLTADLHLGHVNIISYSDRPFSDVGEMNEAIVERWSETVGVNDRVLVLGDVAMGRIDDTLKIAGRLNGVKVLLTGNHDRCASFLGKNTAEWTRRYLDEGGFAEIHQGRCVWTCMRVIGAFSLVTFPTAAIRRTNCATSTSVRRTAGTGFSTAMSTTPGGKPDGRSTWDSMRGGGFTR